MNASAQINGWNAAIQNLEADEAANPQNKASDDQMIAYYQEMKANLQQMQDLAAAYRKSDNDPNLAKQINLVNGRQQTLTQLIDLEKYILQLKEDAKNNPQNAAEDAKKIANAEAQEQVIQEFQSAWEANQQSPNPANTAQLNTLIQELQALREENPSSPPSSGPIWEDFQMVVSQYTVFEFNGQKYGVIPITI
jgi:hypothetical protein